MEWEGKCKCFTYVYNIDHNSVKAGKEEVIMKVFHVCSFCHMLFGRSSERLYVQSVNVGLSVCRHLENSQ